MRILIVDDVDANLYLLKILFTNAGYEIVEAINGKLALEVMQTTDVDLIVSDILMPVMDGFELCKIWQADPRLKKIPFVFYTATYTEENDRKFSLDIGADLFLVKPMESYNLLREIEKVLANHKKIPETEDINATGMGDAAYYEEYSSRLVTKLEAKLLQLEQKNHELMRRDASLRQLNDTLNFQLSKIQLTEASLREHENELLSIVNSMAEGVLTTDQRGMIFEFNPAAEEILGYSRSEAVGELIDMFMPESSHHKHGQYLDSFVNSAADALVGRDMIALNKAGDEVPIRLSVGRLPSGDSRRQMFICTFFDVTKEKQQEEIIARSRKMEVIGNLSGGIAHDYNNMLGVIMGYSELLIESVATEKHRNYIELILHAADRGVSLTRKLLSMSKTMPQSTEVINVNDVINENIDMLEKLVLSKIELDIKLADQIPLVLIDKNDFEDCLLNMCINAMHAIGGNGCISIRTDVSVIKANNRKSLSAGKYLHLSIEDNGYGMSEEVCKKIFDPFFTTKGEKGTGLGLSQAYGFVSRSNGYLGVETEEGIGTRFDFYLPESVEVDQPYEMINTKNNDLIESGRVIMVVDDEPVLLNLIELYLEQSGCKVVVANSAEECLDKLSSVDVDLIISDVIMPGMGGFKLEAIVKDHYPDIKMILMSGYNNEGKGYQLQKPFTRSQLCESVERVFR